MNLQRTNRDCSGLVSLIHSGTTPHNAGWIPTMDWSDSPIKIGYWIGVLAMEYDMLKKNGYDVTETKQDLFNAIESVSRLDLGVDSSQ